MQASEVRIGDRLFYFRRAGKNRVYCVEVLKDGTKISIDYFEQLSPDVLPELQKMVDTLLPDIKLPPVLDPTKNGAFRFYDRGGCGGPCPQFAE